MIETDGVRNFTQPRITEFEPLAKILKPEMLGIEQPVTFAGHLVLAYASATRRRGYDTLNLFLDVVGEVLDRYLGEGVSPSRITKLANRGERILEVFVDLGGGTQVWQLTVLIGQLFLLFTMLAHWSERIVRQSEEIFRSGRPATPQHLQGVAIVIELIRSREAERVRRLVQSYHRWATPRLLASAALANRRGVAHRW